MGGGHSRQIYREMFKPNSLVFQLIHCQIHDIQKGSPQSFSRHKSPGWWQSVKDRKEFSNLLLKSSKCFHLYLYLYNTTLLITRNCTSYSIVISVFYLDDNAIIIQVKNVLYLDDNAIIGYDIVIQRNESRMLYK